MNGDGEMVTEEATGGVKPPQEWTKQRGHPRTVTWYYS